MNDISAREKILAPRVENFLSNSRLTLPAKSLERFLAMCRRKAPKERVEAFQREIEGPGSRELFESLFAAEFDNAKNMDHESMKMIYSFDRGRTDIAKAAKRGMTIQQLKANEYQINREFFDRFLTQDVIPPKVDAIVEIGPAWGGATHYFVERFKPSTYHGYEIDTAWCDWLPENFGLDMKPCDGETLSGTENQSMDIAIASSVLHFMPLEKQWSYLLEMARVLRPGGIAIFNARVVDRLSPVWLEDYMARRFPKRSFALLAQHCIDTAFPEPEFETAIPPGDRGYEVHRRR